MTEMAWASVNRPALTNEHIGQSTAAVDIAVDVYLCLRARVKKEQSSRQCGLAKYIFIFLHHHIKCYTC